MRRRYERALLEVDAVHVRYMEVVTCLRCKMKFFGDPNQPLSNEHSCRAQCVPLPRTPAACPAAPAPPARLSRARAPAIGSCGTFSRRTATSCRRQARASIAPRTRRTTREYGHW